MGYIIGLEEGFGVDDDEDVPAEAYDHFIQYLEDMDITGHIDWCVDAFWEEWWEQNKEEYESEEYESEEDEPQEC